ncbi:MAG: peptidoglycan bridge formation glycyltransferase FemA/FemB family protein [Oscillospiraceae bacterium]|nr:peptidoglycan bridge formation glycyltransferase FemA/FemB family protein [Oscillospiraceae bacterium]
MWREIDIDDIEAVRQMESFVRSHPNGHFLQMPRWANVKDFWKWRGLLFFRNDQLVGAISVLIRPLPCNYSIFYVPRGPVCDRSDSLLWIEMINAIKQLAKKHRAILLDMDPDELDEDCKCRAVMLDYGFKEKTDAGFGNIQPQHVFRLDLAGKSQEEIYQAFTPKTRYNIGLSQRKGVTIREYSGADLIPGQVFETFSDLMLITGERDQFYVRGSQYFENLLRSLKDDARLFIAYYQKQAIAASIEVFCGRKAWYLYGASSNEHRNTMPNYFLQWTMIRRAMERGCKVYDFRGVPGNPDENDPLYGLYRFKKGFSGTYTKFSGLFTYSFKPLYMLVFQVAAKIRKLIVPSIRKAGT